MQNFFEEIISKLAEGKVEFVIVGGISAVLQGASIVTRDLDLCYRRTAENLQRLAAALQPFAPRLRDFPPDLPFVFDERALAQGMNFTLQLGLEDLDLLGEMAGIGGFDNIIELAHDMEVAGITVKVLPLELLIASKKAAGRPKDLAALPVLEATLEMQRGESGPADE